MAFTFPVGVSSVLMCKHIFRSKYERLYSFASYWSTTTYQTQAALQAFTEALHGAVGGTWQNIGDHEAYYSITESDYRSVEGTQRTAYHSAELAGTMGDLLDDAALELEGLPMYSALIIQKTTEKFGRSKRGRFFVPLISEQAQHDGIIDTLNASTCRELADIFQTDREIGTGTASARHWDRKNNTFDPITRCYPLDVLGTRRDRKLGRKGLRIES
jgi:hypothetical protein